MANRNDIRLSGAVYTPESVASAIVKHLSATLPSGPIRTLEPSVGDGAFVEHLPRPVRGGHSYTLVDIDQGVIDQLRQRFGVSAARYVATDFLQFAMEHNKKRRKPFDLIIGNPPFIRKHNFSQGFKDQAEDFAEYFAYPVAYLKNAWAFFLVASLRLVSENGIIAFVLPYELMTVDYGQEILKFASGVVSRIDIFISDEKAFPDIDQDAVLFIARKASEERGVFVNRVKSFSNIDISKTHQIKLDDTSNLALELSAFLLEGEAISSLRLIRAEASVISKFASSAPGIVSAANEYFILRAADVDRSGLSAHVVPILKKGSLAGGSPVFTSVAFQRLKEKEPCLLLVARGERSEVDANLRAYIEEGEKNLIHHRYKCRNRRRWYEVPLVPIEQGFFFKRSHSFPRIILNEAGVYLTDTAYGLRLKPSYTMRGLCFSFYTSLTILFAEIDGRFYGGGVLELSPNEFRGLPIVYHEPSEEDWQSFLAAYAAADGNVDRILDFGDARLKRRKAYSASQLRTMRSAWSAVRSHRMRHGKHSS